MSGCKCNDPRVWEYGPCDYCSGTWCGDCLHDAGECPEDCYCDCNDNTDPDDDIETVKQAIMNDFIDAYDKASEEE